MDDKLDGDAAVLVVAVGLRHPATDKGAVLGVSLAGVIDSG